MHPRSRFLPDVLPLTSDAQRIDEHAEADVVAAQHILNRHIAFDHADAEVLQAVIEDIDLYVRQLDRRRNSCRDQTAGTSPSARTRGDCIQFCVVEC